MQGNISSVLVCGDGFVGRVCLSPEGAILTAPPGWRWSIGYRLAVLRKWLRTFGDVTVEVT